MSRHRAGAAAFLLLAIAGCARGPAPRQFPGAPVVIVSIDTLRADHLPAYGYAKGETPHLDRFRKEAILFENAYTHVPLTLPAHASLFTGVLPFVHGVRDNLGYRLDPKAHPTLAVLLKAKGYATGAAVSAYVLRAGTGLGDGFDFYEDRIASPSGVDALGRVQRTGKETLALVKPWLAERQGPPLLPLLPRLRASRPPRPARALQEPPCPRLRRRGGGQRRGGGRAPRRAAAAWRLRSVDRDRALRSRRGPGRAR